MKPAAFEYHAPDRSRTWSVSRRARRTRRSPRRGAEFVPMLALAWRARARRDSTGCRRSPASSGPAGRSPSRAMTRQAELERSDAADAVPLARPRGALIGHFQTLQPRHGGRARSRTRLPRASCRRRLGAGLRARRCVRPPHPHGSPHQQLFAGTWETAEKAGRVRSVCAGRPFAVDEVARPLRRLRRSPGVGGGYRAGRRVWSAWAADYLLFLGSARLSSTSCGSAPPRTRSRPDARHPPTASRRKSW